MYQKLCHKWTISNFSFCMGGIQKWITSPVFSEGSDNVTWCLKVHPNGFDEESKDYLSIYLMLVSCPESPVWARYEFCIINSQGEKCQSMKRIDVARFQKNQHWGFKKFILRDFLLFHHLLLPKDQLTLLCKVSIVGAFFNNSSLQNMTTVIKDPRHVLADDLGEMWEKPHFTDCCLSVAGQEFRAHKAILAARSTIFRAMFEHENRVEIHDLDPQVFNEMMSFIYTGKSPHLHSHSMATAVLPAADKYGLEGLLVMCDDALCRNLSVENAAHTLTLADLHSREQLKSKVLDFIVLHASEVSETLGWKSMVELHPQLVSESFHFLASAQHIFSEPLLKWLK